MGGQQGLPQESLKWKHRDTGQAPELDRRGLRGGDLIGFVLIFGVLGLIPTFFLRTIPIG